MRRTDRDATGFERTFWQDEAQVDETLSELTHASVNDKSFRLLADNIPTLCWIANGDGYIVWYNRRWHQYCGTTHEEMEGWGWESVHDPDLLPAVKERWHTSIASGEPFEMTFPLRGADGIFRPFLTRIQPVRDGEGRVARWIGVNTEVSETIEAQEALRSAQEEHATFAAEQNAILGQLSEGVIVADKDGKLLFINEAAEQLHGVSRLDVRPEDYSETYHLFTESGEPYPFEELPLTRAVRNGETVTDARWRIRRPDGSEVLAIGSAQPLIVGGEQIGAVLTVSDDTQRHEAEMALRDREERALMAQRATKDAIWDWDLASGHVDWNDALQEAYGFTPEEIDETADWWIDHIHPEDRDRIHDSIFGVIEGDGERWTDEYRFRRSDGSYAAVLDRGFIIRDEEGQATRMIGAMFDLTERQQAEQALRDNQRALSDTLQRLDAIVNNTQMAIFMMDERQHCIFANSAATEMTGYTFAEMQGRPLHDVIHHKYPDGSHYPIEECAIDRAFPEKHETQGEELFVHKDGSFYPVAFTASPVQENDGRTVGTVIEARNIAEEKARDEALRELNQNLEARVAAAIEERELAEEALRQAQKMEAVGQLTGGIAHDFNNLLTVVTGNIDMASRALEASGGDARIERALSGAQKGAQRAAALTQRLLAFSRRQPLDPKPVDPGKLVLGMSDMLNRALGETVKLDIVTAPGLWRTEVDPNQLESALVNLAVNARDAMPDGGGQLTVEIANGRLDESYAARNAEVAPGQYVMIAVTDTGSGMPRHLLDKVFEPFFTTKEVGKGTGLGLSMVYGFVKQSGGHVKIYSEEGQGTTVKLYLPRLIGAVGEHDDDTAAPVEAENSARAERIMVVEDDEDVRSYTVECLRELGYRVIEAPDGPTALAMAQSLDGPLDLLFTDVVMPEMSGQVLADRLRDVRPDLRVLYTSGYTRDAIVHGGRLDTGVEMIAKPFTFTALAQKLRDVLESGKTGRLLVVEEDPTVRSLAGEVLTRTGFSVEEAATAVEALAKVRSAQGRYDCIFLDAGFPEGVVGELRALHADLPILIAARGDEAERYRTRHKHDRCVAVVAKPYTGAQLEEALRKLRVRCNGAPAMDEG